MVTGTLRRFVCGLRGHDALLHFGDGRMSLACHSCGWESSGWAITAPKPEPPARPLLNLRLVRSKVRRVA